MTPARESYGDLVDRLFKKVKEHMDWDDAKTSLWFRTMNPLIGGMTPDTFIAKRPGKAEKWIDGLIEENQVAETEKNNE